MFCPLQRDHLGDAAVGRLAFRSLWEGMDRAIAEQRRTGQPFDGRARMPLAPALDLDQQNSSNDGGTGDKGPSPCAILGGQGERRKGRDQ